MSNIDNLKKELEIAKVKVKNEELALKYEIQMLIDERKELGFKKDTLAIKRNIEKEGRLKSKLNSVYGETVLIERKLNQELKLKKENEKRQLKEKLFEIVALMKKDMSRSEASKMVNVPVEVVNECYTLGKWSDSYYYDFYRAVNEIENKSCVMTMCPRCGSFIKSGEECIRCMSKK